MFLPCSDSKLTRAVASTATATSPSRSGNPRRSPTARHLLVALGDLRAAVNRVDAQRVGVSLGVGEMHGGTVGVTFGVEPRRYDTLRESADLRYGHVDDMHVGGHPHAARE